MKPLLPLAVVAALIAGPAAAAPWGTDYNMGIFAAGGGSDAEGWLRLQCGDPDAGIADYGELDMQVEIAAGRPFKAKNPLDYVQFAVDGESFDIPMEIEDGSSTVLAYVHEAEGSTLTQGLVTALRAGKSVTVSYTGDALAMVNLQGAGEALDAIDSCIRYRS